jgi:hypothetical protein
MRFGDRRDRVEVPARQKRCRADDAAKQGRLLSVADWPSTERELSCPQAP